MSLCLTTASHYLDKITVKRLSVEYIFIRDFNKIIFCINIFIYSGLQTAFRPQSWSQQDVLFLSYYSPYVLLCVVFFKLYTYVLSRVVFFKLHTCVLFYSPLNTFENKFNNLSLSARDLLQTWRLLLTHS